MSDGIRMDNSELDRMTVRFERRAQTSGTAFATALTRITLNLVAYVKTQKLQGQVLNQRSGKLNRSIAQRVTREGNNLEGIVGSIKGHAPHALPLEGGSKPHIIRPKKGKALKFFMSGEAPGAGAEGPTNQSTVYARVVHHPGNKAYRYLRSSLQENRAMIVRELNAAAMRNIAS